MIYDMMYTVYTHSDMMHTHYHSYYCLYYHSYYCLYYHSYYHLTPLEAVAEVFLFVFFFVFFFAEEHLTPLEAVAEVFERSRVVLHLFFLFIRVFPAKFGSLFEICLLPLHKALDAKLYTYTYIFTYIRIYVYVYTPQSP